MLNETIPGGATQDAAGTWRNAEGIALSKTQIAQAEAVMARARVAHDAHEARRQEQALLINPAFAGAVQALNILRVAEAPKEGPAKE